jgi:hypothetical protein
VSHLDNSPTDIRIRSQTEESNAVGEAVDELVRANALYRQLVQD